MFLHARKSHVELLGKGCDRSVRTPELLQNAASSGVGERAERGIEADLAILNHSVQYTTRRLTDCHVRIAMFGRARPALPAMHLNSRLTAQRGPTPAQTSNPGSLSAARQGEGYR